MYADEQTGSRINDTSYAVINSMEERLNVKLEYYREPYAWADMGKYQTDIIAQILAGDAGFDLLFSCSTNFSVLTADGHYFGNFADLKYVDLDKLWHNQSALECMPDDDVDFLLGEFAIGNM